MNEQEDNTGRGGQLAPLSPEQQEHKARRAAKLARLGAKAGYLTDELARIESVASKAMAEACADMMAQMDAYVTEEAIKAGCALIKSIPLVERMRAPGRRATLRVTTPKASVDSSDIEKLFECLGNAADSLAELVIKECAGKPVVHWEGLLAGMRKVDWTWEVSAYTLLLCELEAGEAVEGSRWQLREIKAPVEDGLLSQEDLLPSPTHAVVGALFASNNVL